MTAGNGKAFYIKKGVVKTERPSACLLERNSLRRVLSRYSHQK